MLVYADEACDSKLPVCRGTVQLGTSKDVAGPVAVLHRTVRFERDNHCRIFLLFKYPNSFDEACKHCVSLRRNTAWH